MSNINQLIGHRDTFHELVNLHKNNILPNKIRLNQEKKGFNASIKSLLNLDDEKIRNILMSDSPIFDYINRNKFKEYIKLDHANPIFSKFLFRFVSSKYFLEKFS